MIRDRSARPLATEMARSIEVFALGPMPEVSSGDDLAGLILGAGGSARLEDGDVVVVAQKIISKAEGAVVNLAEVAPSEFACEIARATGKDARTVEVVLRESRRIVKMDRGVLIVETRHGLVCANAGVDRSNVRGVESVTVLPSDPDGSARRIRTEIQDRAGRRVAVIVSDSFNRPWREGSVNVAIGVSGLAPLMDLRGQSDDHGRKLKSTLVALADEIASAAQLAMGETGGTPVAVVRGVRYESGEGGASALQRDAGRDLFR